MNPLNSVNNISPEEGTGGENPPIRALLPASADSWVNSPPFQELLPASIDAWAKNPASIDDWANFTPGTRNPLVPLAIPHSFPRPSPDCFIPYFAPNEPAIVLPNHFLVARNLDEIVPALEEYLNATDGANITYTSTGSSWSGSYEEEYSDCTFRICVYKSKKFPGQHLLEVQRTGGDGFSFGRFYNGLRRKF